MFVSIEELRRHLNLPFTTDDLLLAEYEEAAESVLEKHIGTSLNNYLDGPNGELNAALKLAIKTLVANFYMNREPVSFAQAYKIPYSLEYLIQGFKKYSKD